MRGELFVVRGIHTYIKTSDTSTIVHEMMILYLRDILYSSLELGSTVARRKEYVTLSYSRLWGIHHFVPSGIAVDLTAKKPHVKSPEGRILLEYNLLRYHWVLLLVHPFFVAFLYPSPPDFRFVLENVLNGISLHSVAPNRNKWLQGVKIFVCACKEWYSRVPMKKLFEGKYFVLLSKK